MYNNPTQYLNGTAPVYADRSQVGCDLTNGYLNCLLAPSPDSYLWRDELHPSEQANRVLAGEFINVVSGKSKYATYYSGLRTAASTAGAVSST
jgi:phospholipase/lecithinase/hemolysin